MDLSLRHAWRALKVIFSFLGWEEEEDFQSVCSASYKVAARVCMVAVPAGTVERERVVVGTKTSLFSGQARIIYSMSISSLYLPLCEGYE